MKNFLFIFLSIFLAKSIFAQTATSTANGKYTFTATATDKKINLKVKGTYLGSGITAGRTDYDLYLEKKDALNHAYKTVEMGGTKRDKFLGMRVWLINEAALAINDLKVQNNTGDAKAQLPFFVTLRNLKEGESIQYRILLTSTGDYSKNEFGIEQYGSKKTVDVFFPTKAQAEAFIEDIRSKGFK